MMRLLHWLLIVDSGGSGSIVGYNGGLGIDVDEVVVITVDLGRGTLVVAPVSPRAHAGWAAPAARYSMAGMGVPGWLIDRNRRNKVEMRLEPEIEGRGWMKGQTV
jgi:hypothetical protein